MKRIFLFILVLCVGHTYQVDIQSIIKERVDMGISMGIVVGIIDGKSTTFYSYGKRAASNPEKVDENTIFEIGSITKTFTALLAQQMADMGMFKLNDPVEAYLPDVKISSSGGKKITFKHLLTHSSGLPYMPYNFTCKEISNPFADYLEEDLYNFLKMYKLPRLPGELYEYSNLGFGLLGHIMAILNKKTFEELIVTNICDLLGMKNTRIHLTEDMYQKLAKGHVGEREVPNWDLSVLAGAGALFSSAKDLSIYLAANMGFINTTLYEFMRKLHIPNVPTGKDSEKIGLAWHITSEYSPEIIWHNGGTGGYHCFMGFCPRTKIGVVVLSNSISDVDDIGRHILDKRYPLNPIDDTITLDPFILRQYTGEYGHSSGLIFTISRKGNILMASLTGYPTVEIYPRTDREFFLKIVTADIVFQFNPNGEVAGLVFKQGTQTYEAKKLRSLEEIE